MEGSNSEAVFESLNLSPQLFINEVLNLVDNLVDEAFDLFIREASALLKTEGTDLSAELSKAVAYIRDLVKLTLDERMQKWEEYCLRVCFRVPETFSLPKTTTELAGDDLPDLDALTNTELDEQLNSLRNRLTLVEKESAELGTKLRTLERQSESSNQSAGCIDEALQFYMKHDAPQMFPELTALASDFRAKLQNLKRKKIDETQCDRADKLQARLGDVLRMPRGNGLFGAKLEQLQEFLD